ncbi:hypothetical protein SDC9_112828 [bioreactor metagenome]|uniref:Uncharacterized protein n=1 Tax=bioreactor metagenome TaxID=1076179 RepID=A0A645BVW4_9ZZZZ
MRMDKRKVRLSRKQGIFGEFTIEHTARERKARIDDCRVEISLNHINPSYGKQTLGLLASCLTI